MKRKAPALFRHRHLLSVSDLSVPDIDQIMNTARSMRDIFIRQRIKKAPTLQGRTIINFFVEPSTRTRTSFEIAAKRLSADAYNITGSSSSLVKGESLYDTAKTLEAMAPDLIVIRHSYAGAPHFLAQHLGISVINAGDGQHEHPTQALLDLFTLLEHRGPLAGKIVTIVGDIRHSRVARSNILLLTKMGVQVRVAGPPTLLPPFLETLGAQVFDDLDAALDGVDAVMALRIQLERMKAGYFPNLREYARRWCLNNTRLKRAKRDALVLHPGPINRGAEIDPDVADGQRSVILDQVSNGVAVRMALLYLLLGGGAALGVPAARKG